MRFNRDKGRKSDITSIGDALSEMYSSYKIQGKFDEARLITSWEKLMGKTIAKRTKRIFIKDQVLFVEITSAPLKNELNLSKTKILKIFEEEIGVGIISNIIIM